MKADSSPSFADRRKIVGAIHLTATRHFEEEALPGELNGTHAPAILWEQKDRGDIKPPGRAAATELLKLIGAGREVMVDVLPLSAPWYKGGRTKLGRALKQTVELFGQDRVYPDGRLSIDSLLDLVFEYHLEARGKNLFNLKGGYTYGPLQELLREVSHHLAPGALKAVERKFGRTVTRLCNQLQEERNTQRWGGV